MPTFALKKDSSGKIVALGRWSDENHTLPDGYVSCTADAYSSARSAFMNTLHDQALGTLVMIQQEAALTVAMGGTFGPAMQAYVRALQAIADGSDTTSTALPDRPASISS